MTDPEHDTTIAGEGDYTVTLTGHVTDEAWDRLAAELDEIRQQQGTG